MKKITKSLVMASSILLLGANAYAAKAIPGSFSHASRYEVIETAAVYTKGEAYDLGFQKLQALKGVESGRELSEELGLHSLSYQEKRSTSFASGYITIQEFMDEQGEIMYRGKVNVNYHFFSERDDD